MFTTPKKLRLRNFSLTEKLTSAKFARIKLGGKMVGDKGLEPLTSPV
jgi:hypothetical protein